MKLFKIGFFSCIATFLKVQYGYSNPFNKNNTCHLYGILDIELSFMEEEDACGLELRGIFTAASNEKLEIPGFYNSDYSNALNSLERNNYCFFACVYANYLEQNTSWNMIVYELDELEETEKPRMEYGKNHSDFFSRYEYSDLKSSNRYNNGYFFTNEKDLFMYLIPADNYAIRNLFKEIEKVKVTCLHPLKGKYSETNMVDNSQWREFIPEWP